MKKLFICCDRTARERVVERAKTAFGHSVAVVDDMNRADLAYVVGKVTPEMQKEMQELDRHNLRTVKVNENFINEELYEQVLKGKVHVMEKDYGKGR
jgi:hypothetical protein